MLKEGSSTLHLATHDGVLAFEVMVALNSSLSFVLTLRIDDAVLVINMVNTGGAITTMSTKAVEMRLLALSVTVTVTLMVVFVDDNSA